MAKKNLVPIYLLTAVIFLVILLVGCAPAEPSETRKPVNTQDPEEIHLAIPTDPVEPTREPTGTPTITPAPTLDRDSYLIDLRDLDQYLDYQKSREAPGPYDIRSLYCQGDTGWEDVEFADCASFYKLQSEGCYGQGTLRMNLEVSYDNLCQEIIFLERARRSETDYFDLQDPDWWKSLPAEVIPGRGGIYSKEEVEQAILDRVELVSGKLLGEIEFVRLNSGLDHFEGILTSDELECGVIEDTFDFYPKLLADFDGDGIGELVLSIGRSYQSDTCLLGSGNTLGAFSQVLIKKDHTSDIPSVIPYP